VQTWDIRGMWLTTVAPGLELSGFSTTIFIVQAWIGLLNALSSPLHLLVEAWPHGCGSLPKSLSWDMR
jgi:hypothetical protein